jgi:hypothetical protein
VFANTVVPGEVNFTYTTSPISYRKFFGNIIQIFPSAGKASWFRMILSFSVIFSPTIFDDQEIGVRFIGPSTKAGVATIPVITFSTK